MKCFSRVIFAQKKNVLWCKLITTQITSANKTKSFWIKDEITWYLSADGNGDFVRDMNVNWIVFDRSTLTKFYQRVGPSKFVLTTFLDKTLNCFKNLKSVLSPDNHSDGKVHSNLDNTSFFIPIIHFAFHFDCQLIICVQRKKNLQIITCNPLT